MGIRHDQGIVLRSYPFGEADKVIVLLSPNRGKLRTVAKGIRKTKSRFGGRLEPYSHVDLVLYEGRNLDTITQVSVIEAYPRLRADYDRLLRAAVMAEVSDAVAQEGEHSAGLFLVLQRGLEALEAGAVGDDLLTAFLLRAADVIGVAPALGDCAGCGRPAPAGEPYRFAFAAGGSVCPSCAPSGAYRLRAGVVERLRRLADADLRSLPDLGVDLAADAAGVARRFLEYHLDRRLVSASVLHD